MFAYYLRLAIKSIRRNAVMSLLMVSACSASVDSAPRAKQKARDDTALREKLKKDVAAVQVVAVVKITAVHDYFQDTGLGASGRETCTPRRSSGT